MIELQDIRTIEGLEDIELSSPKLPYIKLLNGTAATRVNQQAGTVVIGSNEHLEVLADRTSTFKFVPIKYFTDWSIWDKETRKLIKRTFDKKVWSTGESVDIADVAWVNGQPPKATKGYNLICYPLTELSKEEPRFMILQLAIRNKFISKTVDKLDQLIKTKVIEEKCSGVYNLVLGLDRELIEDKGNIWMEWQNPTFIQRLDTKYLTIVKNAYSEVKDINRSGTAMIPIESLDQEVYSEVKDATKTNIVMIPIESTKQEFYSESEDTKEF